MGEWTDEEIERGLYEKVFNRLEFTGSQLAFIEAIIREALASKTTRIRELEKEIEKWKPFRFDPRDLIVTISKQALESIIVKLEKRTELIDGCLPIIESWTPQSPAQIEWKKRWVENAKFATLDHGKESSNQ